MNNELDSVVAQGAALETKPLPKSVAPDIGGKRAKRKNDQSLQLMENAISVDRNRKNLLPTGYRNLEGAAGGRHQLLETLKFCPESSNAYKAARRLLENEAAADVQNALSVLCQRNHIRFESLVVAFKDALTAQVATLALTKLAENAPEVLDQVAVDALNRYDACPVCEGVGRVRRISDSGEWALDEHGQPRTQLCYNCRGSGKVFKEHDVQDRKTYLQILGLLEDKKGTTVINQNAIVNRDFQPGDGTFERLVKAVDMVMAHGASREASVDVPFSSYEEDQPNNPV